MEVFETLTYGPFRGAMKCEGQPIQYLAVAIITTELKFNSAEVDLSQSNLLTCCVIQRRCNDVQNAFRDRFT